MKEQDDFACMSELSEKRLIDLSEHVQQCTECRKSIAGIARTHLSGTAKRVPVPKGMDARFMARAAAEGIPFKISRPAGSIVHFSGVLAASAFILCISVSSSKLFHSARVREAHRVTTAASVAVPQKMISPAQSSQPEAKPHHPRPAANMPVEPRKKDRECSCIASESVDDANRAVSLSFSSPVFHFPAFEQKKNNEEALEIAAIPENYADRKSVV